MVCNNKATHTWYSESTDRLISGEVQCGTTYMLKERLCKECQQENEKRYPQGWRDYAGDTCKHGTYVGGMAEDWMCGACECE